MTINLNFDGCFKGCSFSFPCCKTKGEDSDKPEKNTPPDDLSGPTFTRTQTQMMKLLLKGNTAGKAPSRKKEDQLLQRIMENARLYDEFQTSLEGLRAEIEASEPISPRESVVETFSDLFGGIPKIQSSDNRISSFNPDRIDECLKHAPVSPELNSRERQDIIQSVKRTLREEHVRVVCSKRITTILVHELVKKRKELLQPDIKTDALEGIPRNVKQLTFEQRKTLLNRQLTVLWGNAQRRAKEPSLQSGTPSPLSDRTGIEAALTSIKPADEDGITPAPRLENPTNITSV